VGAEVIDIEVHDIKVWTCPGLVDTSDAWVKIHTY
jgi:hypothetical protein